MKLNIFTTLLILMFLTGCMTTGLPNNTKFPGYISSEESVYDGAEEVTLKPAFTISDSALYLGLFWRSNMKNDVIIVAEVLGTYNFDPESSLKFKIDGKEMRLKPSKKYDFGEFHREDYGVHGGLNKSTKTYKANKAFIRKLLNAEHVVVRGELLKSYVEGRFSLTEEELRSYPETQLKLMAQTAFAEFYQKIWPKNETPF